MSRCFPFPPPGYEKKARSDITDLLTKEKHKEKKHRKEKKDKEKKDGKERKDKDKSKDRHREKKDRKEKHKDKKRDKDREKDKNRILDDRRIEKRIEGLDEHKLGIISIPKSEEVDDSRFTEELGRRIRDEEEGAANRILENISGPIPKGVEGLGTTAVLAKERGNGHKMVADLSNNNEQRRIDGIGQTVAERGNGHDMVADVISNKEQRRIDAIGQPVAKDAVKKVERKEKAKGKEADDGKRDKKRDRDREEKRNKGKDKDRHKEKEEREQKTREKGEYKHKEHDKSKNSGKKDQVLKPLAPHNDNENCAGDGHSKKRKDFEMNGFLHENDVWPNKLPRPAASSNPSVENGRTLELSHVPAPHSSSIKHGNTNNIKAENFLNNKEHKINGTAEALLSAVISRPPVTADTSGSSEASLKPPHPDFKYLSQIYSIPKMQEWPESDDQDWLFSGGIPRPKPKAFGAVETPPHVWAEGRQIESADIFALPYVIPY